MPKAQPPKPHPPKAQQPANRPPPIQDYLSPADLKKLQGDYTRAEMDGLLKGVLPRIYEPSHEYLDAISHRFLGDLPSDDAANRTRKTLSIQDRERCIISLLAARGENFTLGLHIYIALMEGISPEEVANILLLAGIYTGVDNLARGLLTEVATLTGLKELLSGSSKPTGRLQAAAPISATIVFGALQQKLSR